MYMTLSELNYCSGLLQRSNIAGILLRAARSTGTFAREPAPTVEPPPPALTKRPNVSAAGHHGGARRLNCKWERVRAGRCSAAAPAATGSCLHPVPQTPHAELRA